MSRFIVGVVVSSAIFLLCSSFAAAQRSTAKVAEISIGGSLPESAGGAGLFGEMEKNLSGMVHRLDRAKDDDDISAVLLKLRTGSMGRAKIHEIRTAIARVRNAGKRVVADLESADSSDYLIASACDEIVMPESGAMFLPGVRMEIMFMKDMLHKIGVEADFMQVGDFKGAAEPYTRSSMSEPSRKQLTMVVDDLYEQTVAMIAKDRKLDQAKVKELIDTGLFSATAAKEAGLIDRIAYQDQAGDTFKETLAVNKVEFIKKYAQTEIDTDFSGFSGMMKLMEMLLGVQDSPLAIAEKKKIACIYAVGAITTGNSTASLFGESTMGSDTIIAALRQAKNDDSVKAIVLRVDSPGGSAIASDLIWREIETIDKPIIASMGDTAASGGYYISMGCDAIFAEPGTLTGSIGVVGGKMVLKQLFDTVGIKTEVISRGKNSGLESMDSKFSDSEREVWFNMMKETYAQFTQKAATGRGMKLEELENLAGGRVWTGNQAKENGLVDELGTLLDALKYAKKEAGIPEGEKAEILFLPKPKTILDLLLEDGLSAQMKANVDMKGELNNLLPGVGDAMGEVQAVQQLFKEPSVLMSPYRLKVK